MPRQTTRSPPQSRRHQYRSRSPKKRKQSRNASPERRKRGSPDYDAYRKQEKSSNRKPNWVEEDISEDDLHREAGGDPVEFRRLKRLKLNDKGVRGFWRNTPTPPPSPEGKDRRSSVTKTTSAEAELNGLGKSQNLGIDNMEGTDHDAGQHGLSAPAGAIGSLQDEILALGPEAAELHGRIATLFSSWLADEKAAAAEAEKRRKQHEADNVLVGPVLEAAEKTEVDYGTHMRPGEGTAMAAYVQSGKRIPRRGEVGMSADQISSFEDLGYVMSGSRHNRMNAIRIRKENQVYTAEEKAALAMFNMEENKRKEQKILGDMQRLVQRTIGEVEEEAEAGSDEEEETKNQ